MTKKSKYIVPGFDRIMDYIHKRMGNKDRHAFEKRLQKDPFLEDAVEGLSEVSEKRAKQDIKSLNELIRKKDSNKTKYPILAIAAAVGVLIVTGISYLAITNYQDSVEKEMISREDHIPTEADEGIKELSMFEKEDLIPDKPEAAASATVVSEPEKRARAQQKPVIIVDEDVAIEGIEDIEADAHLEVVAEAAIESEFSISVDAAKEISNIQIMPFHKEAAEEAGYKTITGKVIDIDDGSPIPGASIFISGTTKGVITDLNGNFSIDIPVDKDVTLIASFVGMKTLEFSPEQFVDNTLAMHSDMVGLSEIVVVGYGTERKMLIRGVERALDAYLEDEEDYPPKPEVGFEEYEIFLNENAKLPEDSHRRRAVVVLDFEINLSGEPQNFAVQRSPDDEFTSMAIELIKNGPKWIPAKSDGETIVEKVRVRIVYRR